MGMAIFWGILAAAFIYSWMIMSGRKAFVLHVPSRAKPDVVIKKMKRLSAVTPPEAVDLGDGILEFDEKIGTKLLKTQARYESSENADSYKTWTRVTDGQKVSEFWEVGMIKPTWFGSISTFAFQGNFHIFVYFLMLFGAVVTYFSLLFTTNRVSQAKLPNTQNNSPLASSRPKPFAGLSTKADNFVGTYGNELFLSFLAILSFSLSFGWDGTLILAPIILVHEYGHVRAFRWFGHTGNKMMLVPFMGGVAIPSGGYRSEYEAAVTALMGPAICIPLSVGLTVLTFAVGDHWTWWYFAWAAMLCASMNALSLYPGLPLDGGHSFQAIARSIAPSQTSPAMLVLTFAGAVFLEFAGYTAFASIVGIWGGSEVARTWNQPSYLEPLSLRKGLQVTAMHLGTLAIHLICAWIVWENFY